jgi:cyclic pyranopterin phosphate synthase
MLIDPFGRIIDYLRISVTDRCNFRCLYCYAPTGSEPARPSRLLGSEEFARLARVAVGLGVRKLKLTGGEPLLFDGIVPLVERLASLPGVEDLSITTNGSRLRKLAGPLRQAGLRRVNLSLDSLRPDRFARISRGGDLEETLAALDAAQRAGLAVKINTVALEGWNADELPDLVRFAEERGAEVRFIEFMPLCGHGWDPDLFLSVRAMRARLQRRYTLRPLDSSGVADRYATDTGARIGFIATMSEPFCEGCRRLRLTAWGALRPCLFSSREVPLGALLADGVGDETLRSAFRRAVQAKPERNGVLAGVEDPRPLRIRSIGG